MVSFVDHLYAVKTIDEVHKEGGKINGFLSYCKFVMPKARHRQLGLTIFVGGGLPAPGSSIYERLLFQFSLKHAPNSPKFHLKY